MNNIKSRLKTPGLQQQIRLQKATERDVLVNRRESVCWTWLVQSEVFIKFVCKLPFTFYFYSLIQFFNFRTKIPLRSRKTAIAQPPPPRPNGHWPFCVTKVGMDVVPKRNINWGSHVPYHFTRNNIFSTYFAPVTFSLLLESPTL